MCYVLPSALSAYKVLWYILISSFCITISVCLLHEQFHLVKWVVKECLFSIYVMSSWYDLLLCPVVFSWNRGNEGFRVLDSQKIDFLYVMKVLLEHDFSPVVSVAFLHFGVPCLAGWIVFVFYCCFSLVCSIFLRFFCI